jgi:hypothetical protein
MILSSVLLAIRAYARPAAPTSPARRAWSCQSVSPTTHSRSVLPPRSTASTSTARPAPRPLRWPAARARSSRSRTRRPPPRGGASGGWSSSASRSTPCTCSASSTSTSSPPSCTAWTPCRPASPRPPPSASSSSSVRPAPDPPIPSHYSSARCWVCDLAGGFWCVQRTVSGRTSSSSRTSGGGTGRRSCAA